MFKKFTTLFSICLIAIPFFTSCGSHVTIKKRLYSSGYYISHGNSKSDAPIDSKEEPAIIDNSKDHSITLNTKSNENEMQLNTNRELTSNNDPAIFKKKSKIEPLINNSVLSNINRSAKEKIELRPSKAYVKDGKRNLNHMKHSDEGLSLFWVVILIILILWAIGYIGGSIGSLINLLLLVALILLILWLLRVI